MLKCYVLLNSKPDFPIDVFSFETILPIGTYFYIKTTCYRILGVTASIDDKNVVGYRVGEVMSSDYPNPKDWNTVIDKC